MHLRRLFVVGYTWNYPMGLVVDPSNSFVYVSDRHSIARINSFDVNGNTNGGTAHTEFYTVTKLTGTTTTGNVDGDSSTARFNEPRFVTIDSAGTFLYVSDVLNYGIRRINLKDSLYPTVTYASFGTNKETNGIALNAAGTILYAVATSLNKIWAIPILSGGAYPSYSSSWMAIGTGTAGQLVDGSLDTAQFNLPSSLTIDDQDNLYVVDNYEKTVAVYKGPTYKYYNNAIRRIDTKNS